MSEIKAGAKVAASGQNGRFEVVEIKGNTAKIKLLANDKETGKPVELNYMVEVPLSALTSLDET